MMRSFTMREKIMITILTFLLLCGFYYFVIQKPIAEQTTSLIMQSEQIDTDTMIASAQNDQLKRMQNEIQALQTQSGGTLTPVPMYDNLLNVMHLLNTSMEGTVEYSLNFEALDTQTDIVRRPITVKFVTSDYSSAKRIIQSLSGSSYRNQIADLQLSVAQNGLAAEFRITFFETLTDSADAQAESAETPASDTSSDMTAA